MKRSADEVPSEEEVKELWDKRGVAIRNFRREHLPKITEMIAMMVLESNGNKSPSDEEKREAISGVDIGLSGDLIAHVFDFALGEVRRPAKKK